MRSLLVRLDQYANIT